MNTDHRIVVLGAGYTGLFSAIRLAHRTRRTGVKITLVNPSSRFVERLRMHQIAAGQELAEHRIPDLLAGTGVTFVQGTATAIDPRPGGSPSTARDPRIRHACLRAGQLDRHRQGFRRRHPGVHPQQPADRRSVRRTAHGGRRVRRHGHRLWRRPDA